jgi:hypothetical protein
MPAMQVAEFRWTRHEDGTWRTNARGLTIPVDPDNEVTVKKDLIGVLREESRGVWALTIHDRGVVPTNYSERGPLKKMAMCANRELRKEIRKLPRDDQRALRITIPSDLADAIDRYVATMSDPDPSGGLRNLNAVAYVGERVVNMYLALNPKQRQS